MPTTLSDLLDAIRLRYTNWIKVELGSGEVCTIPAEGRTLLYVVIAGAVTLEHSGGSLEAPAGTAVFIFNGKPHRVRTLGNPISSRQIRFPAGDRLDQPPVVRPRDGVSAAATIIIGQLDIDAGISNPILSMVDDVMSMTVETLGHLCFNAPMISEITSRPGAMAYLARLGEIFLLRALQTYTYKNIEDDLALRSALGSARVLRALNSVHENPGADWSVERLAKEACMSRSAFATEFVRVVGESPMRLVAAKRLEAAVESLARSSIPVASIARHVGYQSEASFSRVFKQRFGMSPGAYRRLVAQGALAAEHGVPSAG